MTGTEGGDAGRRGHDVGSMQTLSEQAPERGSFSLHGGPLHRLGSRLHLVRGGTNTVALGFAISLSLWGVLVALAFIEGAGRQLFSVAAVGGHVRLLLVIPLFFLCESLLDPRMTVFVRTIVDSGVVPRNAWPALDAEIARIDRWKASWLPDALCLAAAVALMLAAPTVQLPGAALSYHPAQAATEATLAGQWYWGVCLTLFRFLVFRWLWRLALWYGFLWRVSRLPLSLVPTHPDGAAGLGYLEVVHAHFTPLVFALSAVEAASFAEGIATGRTTFEALYPALAIVLVADALLFVMPLLIFAPRLWACRVKGLGDYMVFASRYVDGFDRKWLAAGPRDEKALLGTPDLQSLADLANSFNIVRNMRWAPVSRRLLIDLGLAALLPLLPLLLLAYPIAELAEIFFTKLMGLRA